MNNNGIMEFLNIVHSFLYNMSYGAIKCLIVCECVGREENIINSINCPTTQTQRDILVNFKTTRGVMFMLTTIILFFNLCLVAAAVDNGGCPGFSGLEKACEKGCKNGRTGQIFTFGKTKVFSCSIYSSEDKAWNHIYMAQYPRNSLFYVPPNKANGGSGEKSVFDSLPVPVSGGIVPLTFHSLDKLNGYDMYVIMSKGRNKCAFYIKDLQSNVEYRFSIPGISSYYLRSTTNYPKGSFGTFPPCPTAQMRLSSLDEHLYTEPMKELEAFFNFTDVGAKFELEGARQTVGFSPGGVPGSVQNFGEGSPNVQN